MKKITIRGYIYDVADAVAAELATVQEINKDLCGQLATEIEARTPTLDAINKAKDENKRLNELVFAYESVNAPVNPLLAENKRLRDALEAIRKIPRKRERYADLMMQIISEAEQALKESDQ